MKHAIFGVLSTACIGLTGCAQLANDVSIVSGASIPAQTAVIAANSFDALEATATNYLALCKPPVSSLCKPAAVTPIVQAVRSGRIARNAIEALLAANANAAIPVASFNTLQTAITTLQQIYATYGVATASK